MMKNNLEQTDVVFTCRGALIGLFAYVAVTLIIVWVFY